MNRISPKLWATTGAAVAVLLAVTVWYTASYRPRALFEKAQAAENTEGGFDTAVDCYTRLAGRHSKKWSGTGYWNLYRLYYSKDDPQAGPMLRAAAERDYDEGLARVRLAAAYSGETEVPGIDKNVPAAIEILTVESQRNYDQYRDQSTSRNYGPACALAEIYLFEPGHTDYAKAEKVLRGYFDGSYSKRWPQARHYGAMMIYMGRGSFGSGVGRARGLIDDATLGMPAYYKGNAWLRGPLYGFEGAESSMREALQCFYGAEMGSCRFIDREDLRQRIEILEKFCDTHTEYNDRSHLYGSDEYYWSGAVKPGWETFTNLNIFSYDGQVRGGTPHGIGVGYWQRDNQIFCGEWKNGRCSRGIFVDAQGAVFTGTFDERGRFDKGVRIDPENRRQVY